MDRKALHKYLAPKYRAAKGGVVPDDEDDELDSPEPVEPEPAEQEQEPAEQAEPEQAEPEQSEEADEADDDEPTAPADTAPSVRDPVALKAYLQKQFDAANDGSGVKEARDSANRKNAILGITQGLEEMARSNGTAHGGPGVNHAIYANQMANNNAQVGFAQQDRQAAVQGFLQKQAIDQQVTKQMLAQGTLDQQELAKGYIRAAHTPGSQPSVNAVQMFNKLHPELALDPKTTSLADVEGMAKAVQAKDTAKIKELQVQMRADQAKADAAAASGRAEDKKDKADKDTATRDFRELGKDVDSDLASSRSGIGTAVNKINGAKRVLGFAEVDPAEIEAAKTDPKAKAALIAKLDKLNPQQASEVTLGLMNTVSPGSSSLGQFEHMKAPTASETLANLKQYFTSHPSEGGVGALLENNMQSLNNELKVNQKVLDDHVGKMRVKHPAAFAHESTADNAENLLKAYTSTPADPASGGSASAPSVAGNAPAQPSLDDIEAEIARRKAIRKNGGTAIGLK